METASTCVVTTQHQILQFCPWPYRYLKYRAPSRSKRCCFVPFFFLSTLCSEHRLPTLNQVASFPSGVLLLRAKSVSIKDAGGWPSWAPVNGPVTPLPTSLATVHPMMWMSAPKSNWTRPMQTFVERWKETARRVLLRSKRMG